ncbi:MAG: hypothetical protein M0R00_06250 [Candidatus Omnitrophica bacterium]|jgi:hypothetical protein|nr:hypothetical protein [Candidatus Omnitrophota bacterium]
MYELKLFNNWEQKAQEKRRMRVYDGLRTLRILSKTQVKEITKLIAQSKVKESTDEYTIYQSQ